MIVALLWGCHQKPCAGLSPVNAGAMIHPEPTLSCFNSKKADNFFSGNLPVCLRFFAALFLVWAFLTPIFLPAKVYPATGLMLSKSLPHYTQEMEFYYLKPRPEMLADLLKFMEQSGILAQNDKRMMIAAFFAALSMDNKLDLAKFASKALGHDAARTLAWSAHLASDKNEKTLISYLLGKDDAFLARQIASTPQPLSKWDILEEPAIMQMYWGAFMASGKNVWLDAIINAAQLYGRLETQGLWRQRGYNVGRLAASSLYEFAPRHPRVKKRLEYHLSRSKGMDQATLRKILRK